MPTVIRKKLEKLLKDRKRLEDLIWRLEIAMAPPRIKEQIGQPLSKGSENLLNALSLKGTPYNRLGCVYDKYTGETLKQELPPEQGANVERRERREDTARDLRERYRDIWGKRGFTKMIAHLEDKNIRTIQKYMKDFP